MLKKRRTEKASSSKSVEVAPPWVELPREITEMILQKLDVLEILTTAEKVCRTWRSVCQDPSMWRRINIDGIDKKYDWEKMCRDAVDRSQGQLIDIAIYSFGSDDLLLYISRRSPGLRRLLLAFCYNITDEGVSKAVEYCPLLEELHLYCVWWSGIATIRSAGRHCPHLKSFRSNRWYTSPPLYDEEALAIAESMPQLIHLQLVGNNMTNEGVQAIRKGCPHIEPLDLRLLISMEL